MVFVNRKFIVLVWTNYTRGLIGLKSMNYFYIISHQVCNIVVYYTLNGK